MPAPSLNRSLELIALLLAESSLPPFVGLVLAELTLLAMGDAFLSGEVILPFPGDTAGNECPSLPSNCTVQ